MATRFRVLKKEVRFRSGNAFQKTDAPKKGQKFCVVDRNKPSPTLEVQAADKVQTDANVENRGTENTCPDESGRYQTDIWSDLLDAVKKKQQEARARVDDVLKEEASQAPDGEGAGAALSFAAFPLPRSATLRATGQEQKAERDANQTFETAVEHEVKPAFDFRRLKPVAPYERKEPDKNEDALPSLEQGAVPHTGANPVPDADMDFEMFCRRFVPVSAEERKMILKGQKLESTAKPDASLAPVKPATTVDMEEPAVSEKEQEITVMSRQSSHSTITPLSPVFTIARNSGLRASDSSSVRGHAVEKTNRMSTEEPTRTSDEAAVTNSSNSPVAASFEAQRAFLDLQADFLASKASVMDSARYTPRSNSVSSSSDKVTGSEMANISGGSRKSSWASVPSNHESFSSSNGSADSIDASSRFTPGRNTVPLRVATPNPFKSTLRVSKEEPRISLHTGSTPFTPRHNPALGGGQNRSRSKSNTPQSLDKPIKSILRSSGSQVASPTDQASTLDLRNQSPIFSPNTPSPCDLLSVPRIRSSNQSSLYGDGGHLSTQTGGSLGPTKSGSVSSKAEIVHETPESLRSLSEPSPASRGSADGCILTTPERKKLEARSPYGNRPSPRSKIGLDDDEGDQSIKTTAALVNLCRAGPSPLFHPSETYVPSANTSEVSLVKKKRSLKDLCRDIITNPTVLSNPGQRAASVDIPPLPPLPLVARRKKSMPQKLEGAFNTFGRKSKKKKRGDLDEIFLRLNNFASPEELEIAGGTLGIRRIERSGSGAVSKWRSKIQEIKKNSSLSNDRSEWTILPSTPGVRRFSEIIPIEMDDETRPQSRLPQLPDVTTGGVVDEQRCSSCDRKCTTGADGSGKSLVPCQECRSAPICELGLACFRDHMQVCPMIQRPHTSFRTHMSHLPDSLRAKAIYLAWQKGSYVDMHDRLEEMSNAFHKQLSEGQGRLLKDLGKELDWSTSKIGQGIKGLDELELDAIQERFLRRVFMMPKLAPRAGDPSSKHPNHSYHRKTAMLNCLEHHGHCANCGVECCVARAMELDLQRSSLHPLELQAIQSIHSEVVVWMRRGEPSNMMQCTACIGEGFDWKYYCPNCFGVCPVGCDGNISGCGDVLCVKHQSKPNTPCEWHWR